MTATEGQLFSGVVATFSDATPQAPLGDFPLTKIKIQWGDGGSSNATAITQPGNAGTTFYVYGSHMYAEEDPTAKPLTVTITDLDGAVGTTSFQPAVADAPLTVSGNIRDFHRDGRDVHGHADPGPVHRRRSRRCDQRLLRDDPVA